jgi:hypothetical protein
MSLRGSAQEDSRLAAAQRGQRPQRSRPHRDTGITGDVPILTIGRRVSRDPEQTNRGGRRGAGDGRDSCDAWPPAFRPAHGSRGHNHKRPHETHALVIAPSLDPCRATARAARAVRGAAAGRRPERPAQGSRSGRNRKCPIRKTHGTCDSCLTSIPAARARSRCSADCT